MDYHRTYIDRLRASQDYLFHLFYLSVVFMGKQRFQSSGEKSNEEIMFHEGWNVTKSDWELAHLVANHHSREKLVSFLDYYLFPFRRHRLANGRWYMKWCTHHRHLEDHTRSQSWLEGVRQTIPKDMLKLALDYLIVKGASVVDHNSEIDFNEWIRDMTSSGSIISESLKQKASVEDARMRELVDLQT